MAESGHIEIVRLLLQYVEKTPMKAEVYVTRAGRGDIAKLIRQEAQEFNASTISNIQTEEELNISRLLHASQEADESRLLELVQRNLYKRD